jgi:hypothetical protein
VVVIAPLLRGVCVSLTSSSSFTKKKKGLKSLGTLSFAMKADKRRSLIFVSRQKEEKVHERSKYKTEMKCYSVEYTYADVLSEGGGVSIC